MTPAEYSLQILDLTIRPLASGGGEEIVLTWKGREAASELRQKLASGSGPDIFAACEALAQAIFAAEFRLNDPSGLSFSFEDQDAMSLWHTKPHLFVKCPLTMRMHWSCHHLRQAFPTMITLGIIEMPDEAELRGNALAPRETAKVILASMASGIEFMGNMMLKRDSIDHEAEIRRGLPQRPAPSASLHG